MECNFSRFALATNSDDIMNSYVDMQGQGKVSIEHLNAQQDKLVSNNGRPICHCQMEQVNKEKVPKSLLYSMKVAAKVVTKRLEGLLFLQLIKQLEPLSVQSEMGQQNSFVAFKLSLSDKLRNGSFEIILQLNYLQM